MLLKPNFIIMRVQLDDATCGPVAVANVLRALGRDVTELDVIPHCGMTEKDGVAQYGLMQAVERLGHGFEELSLPYADAYEVLRGHLETGGAAVLSTEKGEHWIAAVGILGPRTLVYDGQPSRRRRGESGLLVLTREQLRREWSSGRTRYALLVKQRA